MDRPSTRLLLAVAGLALLAGACSPVSIEMTAEDARTFTRQALEELGFSDIRVEEGVVAGVYPEQSPRAVPVWRTRATVAGGSVQLFVMRMGDRAVFLQDQTDDSDELFSAEQVRALERFRYNPAAERLQAAKAVPAALAAVALLAAAGGVGVVALRREGQVRWGVRGSLRGARRR